jgi:hypothetical protein
MAIGGIWYWNEKKKEIFALTRQIKAEHGIEKFRSAMTI